MFATLLINTLVSSCIEYYRNSCFKKGKFAFHISKFIQNRYQWSKLCCNFMVSNSTTAMMSFFWDCYLFADVNKNVWKYHIWDKYVKFLVDKYQGSPPDKCRSIVKKAGEPISQTHFPQFFLHFYSDQNRRQTLGLLYFGNFKISINMPHFYSSSLSPRICVAYHSLWRNKKLGEEGPEVSIF